jgi:site-specific DNA-methyltransferase (adenine-specific)
MPLEITYRKVDDLIPYARNSRTHSSSQVNQIAGSIKEFGFTNPILIDGEGVIIAGHGRVMAARLLDLPEVPTITLANLTESQKKAYVIADNKLAMNAGWDEEMLKVEFEDLIQSGFDVGLTGFDPDELQSFDINDTIPESVEKDAMPEIENDPCIKVGDVIGIGDHRIVCGDSTDPLVIQSLMGGDLADLLVTDPPYNVNYEGKTKKALTIKNDSLQDEDFRAFLFLALKCADSVMKPGAVFYIWHADSEGFNFRGACRDVGWKVRQCLIWKKNSLVMGRQDYHWQHEPCLYGWRDGAAHLWASDRKQTTVLEFDRPSRNDIHPTMKPVDLIEYTICNNTKGKDLVLDIFLGGGSTLIACETSGRKCRGVELDPKYVQAVIQRWCDLTKRDDIVINEKQSSWSQYKNSDNALRLRD